MSKIKNGGLDQHGAEPFQQQQFEAAGVEGVNRFYSIDVVSVDEQLYSLGCRQEHWLLTWKDLELQDKHLECTYDLSDAKFYWIHRNMFV